jgi:NADPH:quinone reductase-like Zn-dependent oxidoreductase
MMAFIPSGDPTSFVTLGEAPDPTPAADEALVAVDAYSVNRGETFLLERPAEGWRPGKDVAGRVIRAAQDGSGPREGARVVAHPPAAGWAERVAVKTGQIAELPDAMSTVTAAALPLAGLTALRLLRAAGPVASLRLLMTGASGGVGHYFTELAANAGAEVTVVSATPQRGERLRALGARHVVQDLDEAEGPFDVVLESVGGDSLQKALVKLKRRGTLIWFGQASRKGAAVDFFKFWEGPASGVIRHFDYTDSDVLDGRDLDTLVAWVARDRLHPEIGLIADWAETPRVLQMLRDRGIRGNAVLTISKEGCG